MSFRTSVIVPCRNTGPWIAEALGSVANQTLAPHEVIVIDDGSQDDTVQQVHRSHVPTRVIHVDVHNAAAARNAGIEVATGDWVALLDADDVWYPQHLARASDLLLRSGDVAYIANHDWISLTSEPIEIPASLQCRVSHPKSSLSLDDFFCIIEQGFHFGHSTVVYHRDQVLKAGSFDVSQRRRHDIDLWLRVISRGTWSYDTVKGAGYREATPGSISKNDDECDYFELRALVKNMGRDASPPVRRYIARQARRAMGRAFAGVSSEHYERIRGLAWPLLPNGFKAAYAISGIWPAAVRGLIKAKRRMTPARRLADRHAGTSISNTREQA